MDIQEVLARYMKWVRPRVSKQTLITKRDHLATFIKFIGSIYMGDVTSEAVEEYVNAQRDKKLKKTTIFSYLVTLGAFFAWAVEAKIITTNPVTPVKKSCPKGETKHKPVDSPERLRDQLLAVADCDRDRLVVELLVALGLRSIEASRAKYSDIEYLPVGGEQVPCLRIVGKGHEETEPDYLPLNPDLFDLLMAAKNGNPYLLPNLRKKGEGMKPKTVGRVIKDLTGKAGLDITAHTLRASLCTEICRQYGITYAQKVLRHKNIATTQIYARHGLEDALEALTVAQRRTP